MKSVITIEHLKKSFGVVSVFDDFNIAFEEGKITALIGPNGSGKSTIFNIVTKIIPYESGQVTLKNSCPFSFSYIFQNYRDSLLPWKTGLENLVFPLQIQHLSVKEISKRLSEIQNLLPIPIDLEKYPYELSGGQQQILSILRALITNPALLLIDEPFSALDYENNLRAIQCIQTYYLKRSPTILLITHTIEEAVQLAENIVILSRKPTYVVKTVHNDIPYPRTTRTLQTEAFFALKRTLLSDFSLVTGI